MKIKSAKSFRYWYKTKIKEIDRNDPTHNENFAGTYHKENGKKTIKGFFEMYHGDKPDIASYLPSILKIAEDGQAIYEFLQNAVDCGSTHFYIFYNDKYFLAINNGSPFDVEGLQSILNIAQTTKKDPNKIGRFGIGFKLAHRLVGKNEGTDELVRQYKGPILFSWAKLQDLESLLNNEHIEPLVPNKENSQEFINSPYLLKLLLTNFPSDPNERVKDINYQDKILFPQAELKELIDFLNENFQQHSDSLKKNVLKQGSLFFIKLGEDKKKLLDKDYSELVNGIQYSMNTLKRLQKVYINNDDIGKIPLQLEEGTIKKGSDEFERISPEYKEFDIKFAIGFNTIKFGNEKSYEQIKLLKEKPNFYKYFPMGDEINGLSFIVHCDSFSNEANRRKLHEDDVNRNLFPELAKFITQRLDEYKANNRNKFLNLYASLLLSDIPERQNNKWLKPVFYDTLLEYIQTNIPTTDDIIEEIDNIKIKKFDFDISLSDLGLSDIHWFYWKEDEDQYLLNEATSNEKIGIEEWSLRDVFINADLDCLNDWIKGLPQKDYDIFLKELDKEYFSKDAIERLLETELFKFSDGQFYSINEVSNNEDLVFLSNKVVSIQKELKSLDFSISDLDISAFSFYDKVSSKLKSDEDLYDTISERTSTENNLTVNQKQNLFKNFINPATKFIGIGDETLKKLELFCDNQGEIKPLFQLVNSSLKKYTWLNPYKIKADENFEKLSNYLIQEEDLFDKIILPNIEVIKEELTEAKEIKELVTFFKENHRPFFNEYIIQKRTNDYEIIDKSDKFQIVPPKDERKTFIDFIETYLSDELIVLPYDFSDFNDQDGILKGEKLHSQILELVDVDVHKETLVDFIHYNEPKRKFLQEISIFNFNSEATYTKEDYEYKILDLACSELKENDYSTFKDKITIQTEEQDLALSQIPSSADRIVIDHKELSQSQILPNEAKNGKYLSDLLEQFITIGLQKEQLYKLFGIQSGNDPKQVFEILKQEYDVLENAQQLTFVLLYAKEFGGNIENFKVEALDDKEWELKYNYYTQTLSFIGADCLLKPKYSEVSKIISLPIEICNSDYQILHQPYFLENKFVCPSLKSDLSEEEKIALIDFLYSEWRKDTNGQKIKNIDWSKIDDIETENILGFNPNHSVFPSKYACESEVLPDYLIKWIGKDENKISFLSDLGVWTENSVVVELRNFLKGNSKGFHNNRLAQETRFNDDETTLFNAFEWLKENEIELSTDEQYETFKKIKEIINDNRNNNDLVIQDEYDYVELEENSIEWKETESYTIYLYDEEMPKTVGLDEIDEYVFYRYNEDNYAINENAIYLNSKEDKKKTLQKIASDEENDFTFEDLWALFGESSNREQELEREIARLQQQVSKTDNATLGAEFSSDISKNDQKEANREAKEQVKQRLENEGFDFTQGIGNYSTIDGVLKDGIEFPLVVKSYKYQDEPLKIGANEWIQLMKPNSMFWVNFGYGKLGCLKLYELLRNQDKLTISFSTENLDVGDRLDKFAELLHYFGNVHFDFNSVMPSNVASNLSDYRFDERKTEEDLSSDDESLL